MVRYLLTLVLLSQVAVAMAQLPIAIPTAQLVGYWPLDSSVNNAANTLHHGTATNANPTFDRFGNPNSAYQLSGLNAYLTLPVSVMNQVGSGAFTVSIWVSPDTNVAATNGMEIISDKTAGSWLHKFRIAVGAIAAGYSPDSTYWDAIVGSNVVPKVVGPGLLADGWWHLVFVYENIQGGRFTAYRNGVMVGQTTNTSTSSGARQINVGRAIWPGAPAIGTNFFKGKVDDIGVWSRALTPAEVLGLYYLCNLSANLITPNQFITAGGTTQFAVSTPSTNAFYQWQIDSTNTATYLPLANGGVFSGVDSNVLLLSHVRGNMNGWKFRCLVGDSLCTTSSTAGVLHVSCNIVVGTPSDGSFLPGDSAFFTIGATQPTHQYQWQILIAGSWVNLADFGQFAGSRTARLVVRNLSNLNHNQRFRCLVSAFGCNDTSASATLNVLCQPRSLNGPTNAGVVEAQTATFQVDSVAGATYNWQRNVGFGFQNLSNGGNVQGVNQPVLRISNVQWSDNLTGYRCIVQKDHCADTSGTALLEVVGGVSVRENELSIWKMYPNPAKNEVMLERRGSPSVSWLVVRNALGQLMLQAEVAEQTFKLNTTGWSEGIYLVEWEGRSQRLLLSR